jgi:predicted RNase H-like nuclease (RuvC/YqgF family)
MRNGEPIGFVDGEGSPEIKEIVIAIKEADEWIAIDRQDIHDLETRIEVEEEMITYSAEHNLESPNVSIDDLRNQLEEARRRLERDVNLRDELIKLQQNFQTLDWQHNLQEIKMKHFLEKTPQKPVD